MAGGLFFLYNSDMDIWIEFNGNPTGRKVGDCAVRAVSVALGVDWETAFAMLAKNAFF